MNAIRTPASAPTLQSRIDRLRQLDLRYIPATEFTQLTEVLLQKQAPKNLFQEESEQVDSPKLGSPLLTPEGEKHLFRSLNFLKFRAEQRRRKLKKQAALVERLERLWQDIQRVRTTIVQANLRLVAALAHKYASTPEEVDEFVSEGNVILVNAIDKFDHTRGFRFSTYATHSVQRHFFRLIHRRQRRKLRERFSTGEVLGNLAAEIPTEDPFNPHVAEALISRFDDCLNSRERAILEQRFGLQGECSATLKTISEKVGLSKERVRQLQMGAIEKLQDLAIQLRLRPETCL